MNKKLFAVVILMFPLFIVASCDNSIKTAIFHIHNNSQFQVTEIGVLSRSSENGFKEILEPGENCTLISEWVDGKTVSAYISFYMNGEEYGTREREEAMTDTRRFKPYKRISNGDTITVRIYDDRWEW
jgi:hypothetical protein